MFKDIMFWSSNVNVSRLMEYGLRDSCVRGLIS